MEPPPNLLMDAIAAVSAFAPVSIVMVSPGRKPIAAATGMTVAPAAVAAAAVVAPAVPTVAITAVSLAAPVSMVIVWPGLKPSTLSTFILVAAVAVATDRVAAAWVKKSPQLLAVSAPSGKRPALVLVRAAAMLRPKFMATPGEI